MQFQVPQFIEVQDKIIGGILTLRQFIYLAGAGGLSFLIYKILPSIYLSGLPIIVVVGFGIALAFYKVNGKPFIEVVEAAFKYSTGAKLFIWRKRDKVATATPETITTDSVAQMYVPRLSDSKLKDLTWSLDVKDVGKR
ncbi:MAG: hypothetical protein RLZZ347_839 [Candidatus Parcubacteria bacterium]|jgi:hypothetical protein